MKGFGWAIKHTVLTLMGKKDYLLEGGWGSYSSKRAVIKAIWRVRKSA